MKNHEDQKNNEQVLSELGQIESFRNRMKNYFGDRILFEYDFCSDGEVQIRASLREGGPAFLTKQLVLSLDPEEAIDQIETKLIEEEG